MFGWGKCFSFNRLRVNVFKNFHPMACIAFMRQDVELPLKKGKKLIQYLKNNQTYMREISYLSKERSFYGKN